MDELLIRTLHGATAPHPLVWAMLAFTALGSGWSLLALTPLLVRAKTRRWATGLLASVVATAVLVFALKHLVRRPRPCTYVPGVAAIGIRAPTDPSFPSGHAAGSFTVAAYVVVSTRRRSQSANGSFPLLPVMVFSAASAVALSRVFLGVHFPSDVAVGALLGCASGTLGGLRVRSTPTA